MEEYYRNITEITGSVNEFLEQVNKTYKCAKILFVGSKEEGCEYFNCFSKHIIYFARNNKELAQYEDSGINIAVVAADYNESFKILKNWPLKLVFAPDFENMYAIYPYRTEISYILLLSNRIADIKFDKAADLYGGIMSNIVTLFDYYFASRVYNRPFIKERFSALKEILENILKIDPKNISEEDKYNLAKSACAIASKSPSNGGDYCLFLANVMIQKARREYIAPFGQLRFISALKVIKAYVHTVYNLNCDSYPPPVYVVRSRVYKIYTSQCPCLTINKDSYEIVRYRYREYKEDLKNLLKEMIAAGTKAERNFRRFFEDAGLKISTYEKTLNNAAALYIAPDTANNYSMLSFMRDSGILEILAYDNKRKRKI